MGTTSFRSRLAGGERLFGTMVTLRCAATAEILAGCGFDWLFVDGEHGPLERQDILSILQAVGDKAACIVRVPETSDAAIKSVLDLGADGIIVPQVNTAQQARDVVRFAKYAPDGARGVGLARAHGYGMHFKEYIESANDTIAIIVQAEHATAVDNIESIVQVPGVDAVLLGPYDLAASLGKMGQVNAPEVVAAIDRIVAACREASMPVGYFGVSVDAIRPYMERGCTLIVAGVDTLFLGQSATTILDEIRAGSDDS